MKIALITGAESGLGFLIAQELRKNVNVVTVGRSRGDLICDLSDPNFTDVLPPIDVDILINCAGVNKIAWLEDVNVKDWDEVMNVNHKAMFLMVQKYIEPLKKNKGTILNIVSNAAHMPMRCSAAYNSSKAAALMLTKQLARELAPDVTVFSVSPNKMFGTRMSDDIDEQVMKVRGWSEHQAAEYQKQSLLTGEETNPHTVAEFIAFLLSSKERHFYLTGCDIPYGN